jgi:riboflavin biosynthesis pyrimidine reductase
VAALHARGLKLLFVEGGGVTVSRFLAQGCLDRLHLAVAPVLIGNGRPGLRFTGAERLADCLRPPCRVHAMGCDQLWDLDLRPG